MKKRGILLFFFTNINKKYNTMKAVEFKEANVVMGAGQDEYNDLPAKTNFTDGSLSFCFGLDEEEIKKVVETGEIWVKVLTFGKPMQPIFVTTEKSEVVCS